jgi:hypothetical protein
MMPCATVAMVWLLTSRFFFCATLLTRKGGAAWSPDLAGMETHAGSQEHKAAQRVVCHTFISDGVPHTAPVRTAKTSAACQEDDDERECTPARQCGRNGLDIGSQQCSRQGRRQRWAHVPAVLMLLWVGAPSIAQPPTPEISTLTPHAGHAAGGYSVTIGGHGFVIDGSATYMCTFACKSLSVSTAARVLSGANVTCPVPLWTAAPSYKTRVYVYYVVLVISDTW